MCRDGGCLTLCPGNQVICGTGCVDPNSNANVCGASGDCSGANAGVVCRANAYCSSGACPCNPGLVDCNGTCTTSCPASTTCAPGQTTGCGAEVGLAPAAMSPAYSCPSGNYYNGCGSNAYTLAWTDTIGLAPIAIELQFIQGITCSGAVATETITFNGATFGSFSEQASQCTCTPSAYTPTTLSSADAAVLAAFVPGGTNAFRFTPASNCEGLRPDGQGYIGWAILTY